MGAPRSTRSNGLDLCLKFTDTIDWRMSGHPDESLRSYSDLVKWSIRRGVIDDGEAGRLLRFAESEPAIAADTLEEAKSLREAIYSIFSTVAGGKRAQATDVGVLNRHLARAMAKMEVQVTDEGYRLGWCSDQVADKMLYPVAKSAAELLTSDELDRLKQCANEDDGCGSLFLDSSKSHSRRWCSMDSCGNKTKVRTYYAKHRQQPERKVAA